MLLTQDSIARWIERLRVEKPVVQCNRDDLIDLLSALLSVMDRHRTECRWIRLYERSRTQQHRRIREVRGQRRELLSQLHEVVGLYVDAEERASELERLP